MLFLTLSLLFVVAGMHSADSQHVQPVQKCLEGVDLEQLEGMIENRNINEMDIICPQVLPALKCIDDAMEEEIGLRIADVAKMMPDEDRGKAATLFLNIQGLLEEVCDSDSDLHKNYSRHSDCLKSIPNSKVEDCVDEAYSSFRAYNRESENQIEDRSGKFRKSDMRCLVNAMISACVAAEIHDTCGVEAFHTYQTVVKRINIFRLGYCSQEDLDELKTDFLNSLNLEGEKKGLFRLAFDLRKRRK